MPLTPAQMNATNQNNDTAGPNVFLYLEIQRTLKRNRIARAKYWHCIQRIKLHTQTPCTGFELIDSFNELRDFMEGRGVDHN